MNNQRTKEKICLIMAGGLTAYISSMILTGRYTPWLAIFWVLSSFILLLGTARASTEKLKKLRFTPRSVIIMCIVLLPVFVRVMSYQPDRIHGDDLLTATFSLQYRALTTNFFSGIPEGTEWVAKFPTLYFLFQKIFLGIFGASILTVKLSVLPYIFIVSAMTYLIGSLLIGPVAGVIAVVIYAFMAVSIYHETLGLHFISSTALYMVFLYTLLRAQKDTKTFWYAASGVTCGLCYLSYTASYIALPILVIALFYDFIEKKSSVMRWAVWSLIGFVVVMAPFITYAATQENYFGGRINQVSLLTGSWSAGKLTDFSVLHAGKLISESLTVSVLSLVKSGIGGHGGYLFNQQAFFHPTGLILFVCGLIYVLFLMKKNIGMRLSLLSILLTFLTGMVLTIPPPAFHRLTLAFPLIAIVSAAPFSLVSLRNKTAVTLTLILLAVYAGTNIRYAQTASQPETLIEDAAIIKFINATYPERQIHVAAFPSFALGKFFPFFTSTTAPTIDTKFHKDYLADPAYTTPFVFIITLPREFRTDFERMYPAASYVPYSDKYGLLVN